MPLNRYQQNVFINCPFDPAKYRYQSFCSDIAGQDVRSHKDDPAAAIRLVRHWLRTATAGSGVNIPGASTIQTRYETFREDLPVMCRELHLDEDDLIFSDYTTLMAAWQQANAW